MKELPIFSARIKNGKLMIDNRRAFDAFIVGLGDSTQVSVEVRKWSRRRSLGQNNLLWFCYNIIASYTGYDPIEIHEISKRHCLIPKYILEPDGKEIQMFSTTFLEKGEVDDYLRRVEAYWRQFNSDITLPLDNPNLEIK